MALSHSRDGCVAPGAKFVVFFDSAKQETELDQLRKEERLVKVITTLLVSLVSHPVLSPVHVRIARCIVARSTTPAQISFGQMVLLALKFNIKAAFLVCTIAE